jgi:ABC-type amino acid transport substrate-binding protein
MVSRSFDDFLLAFGQANAFVFNSTAQMQSAAKNMWADIKDRPDEVEAFIKEVNSKLIQKFNKILRQMTENGDAQARGGTRTRSR